MLVVKFVEPWARGHQQRWHSEALQMYGERIVVRHRWNIQDYALGKVARCTTCSAGVRLNEQQRLRVITATGGTFTLTFAGQTTAALQWDASATEIQAALIALEVNSAGDVIVSGAQEDTLQSPGLVVEFKGQWASVENIPNLTYDAASLTPSGSVEVIQIRPGTGGTSVQERVAAVYKQAGNSWCTSCYGVGFEGGFEPIIYVTPALITDQQQETTMSRSGQIQREDPTVQFSYEPLVQEFDLMARVKTWDTDGITPVKIGGRFLLREVKPVTLRTGPGSPDDSIAVIPEKYQTIADRTTPFPEWVVGQEGGIEILPYEHSMNLVPLSRAEETLAEVGVLLNRKWYLQAGATAPFAAEEAHP